MEMVYVLKHIQAVGRGGNFPLQLPKKIPLNPFTSVFSCAVLGLLMCTWKPPCEVTAGDSSKAHPLGHPKIRVHWSLKTTAHSDLYGDSLGGESRVKKKPKKMVLPTKPCIGMDRAAEFCVNLEN